MRGITRRLVTRFISLALSLVLGVGPGLQGMSVARAAEQPPTPTPITTPAPQTPEVTSTAGTSAVSTASADGTPTVVREIVEKRTENSTHYLLSNGKMRAVITEVPTRFRDRAGDMVDINTSLVPADETGAVETAATSVTATFDVQEPAEAPVTLDGPGYSVGVDMLGVAENARVVIGNTTRYLGVAKDTDLEYEAVRDGIKETVVLKSAEAPSTHSFQLDLDGVEMRTNPLGGRGLYRTGDTTSTPVLELRPLVVFDSSVNDGDEPAYCSEATMSVEVRGDGSTFVTYEVSPEWLKDPARVFPVMVDPTFTGAAPTADAYVTSAYPNNSYGGSTELKCGYYDSTTGQNRSFVKFYWSSSVLPNDCYIDSANLQLYLFHQYYTNTATEVRIGKVTGTWSSPTWNTKPAYAYFASQYPQGRGVWVTQPCATQVQGWVNDYSTNHGFMLYQIESGSQNTTHWKKFYSSDYSNTSVLPRLVVDYSVPYSEIMQYASSYKVGDTVKVQVVVHTPDYTDVSEISAILNYMGNDNVAGGDPNRYRGYMRWGTSSPGTGWDTWPLGAGYVSINQSVSWGYDHLTFLPTQCEYGVEMTPGLEYRRVAFAFRIDEDWGNIQDNDIDTSFAMVTGWTTGWKWNDTNIDVQPAPVTSISAQTTASAGWFREVDGDGNGLADNTNDLPDAGRGAVTVNWTPTAGAEGYRIYASDGGAYQPVGAVPGGSSASWSSAGAGIFPKDSRFTTRTANSWTDNPFAGAQSPMLSTRGAVVTDSLPEGGAGVVVSDGTRLYTRAWSGGYPGPQRWTVVGSGLHGTTAGEVLGNVGPESEPVLSAFLRDGAIWNGYATTSTTIKGVSTADVSGTMPLLTKTFSDELLDRTSGLPLTAPSGNVLLASSSKNVYSVAYNRGSGDIGDGFRIRVYDSKNAWIGDHDIVTASYLTDGVMADEHNLYLIEWSGAHRITKISTDSWRIVGQWSTGWSATREISGCYDPANDVFFTGALDNGSIYRYAGPGLDLRDDPNALYRATDGISFDATHTYSFKVAPYNSAGEVPVELNAAVMPTLDNRTVHVDDDPRHTTADLGDLSGDAASAELDSGALQLRTSDLSIPSWGPEAAVTRTYDSNLTTATLFAQGWRFSFERAISKDGTRAVMTDEDGTRTRSATRRPRTPGPPPTACSPR